MLPRSPGPFAQREQRFQVADETEGVLELWSRDRDSVGSSVVCHRDGSKENNRIGRGFSKWGKQGLLVLPLRGGSSLPPSRTLLEGKQARACQGELQGSTSTAANLSNDATPARTELFSSLRVPSADSRYVELTGSGVEGAELTDTA